MGRIAQDPQVRINEILDVAERLFVTKGYRGTTMSDIAEAMSVAKGMCYYYFPSKEAILEAVCARYTDAFSESVAVIASLKHVSAADKIGLMISAALNGMAVRDEQLMQVIYEDRYLQIRYRLMRQVREAINPAGLKIIAEGCANGEFNVYDAQVAFDFTLLVVKSLNDVFWEKQVRTIEGSHLRMAEAVVETALDSAKGTIKIVL